MCGDDFSDYKCLGCGTYGEFESKSFDPTVDLRCSKCGRKVEVGDWSDEKQEGEGEALKKIEEFMERTKADKEPKGGAGARGNEMPNVQE